VKRILFSILSGCFLLLAQACAGSGDNPDGGQEDVDLSGVEDIGPRDAGCHLGCDGNVDDSVFITIVDDETGLELCCPITVRINDRNISNNRPDGGVVEDGCECTWEEEGRRAFFVAQEWVLTLVANNLFEIELEGYEPWQTEKYVPCVCVPHVEFTARLTPE